MRCIADDDVRVMARVNTAKENKMSRKNKAPTVLVRLVLDKVREGENGDTLVVVIASDGKRYKMILRDVVAIEEPDDE